MPAETFCPRCGALLSPRRRDGALEWACARCGHGPRARGRAQRKTAHPEFPLFPYQQIRGGQREFMKDVRSAMESGKVLLAHAPTGIGKTVATLSVLLERTTEERRAVFFLTSKQSQHTIVIHTLREIAECSPRQIRVVDVIAKQALCPSVDTSMPGYAFAEYCRMRTKSRTCPYGGEVTGDVRERIHGQIMHVQELQAVCVDAGVCPHKAALDAMPGAEVIVCDYNYVFDVMAQGVLDRAGRALDEIVLVVDEAHNLPERIRGNLSMDLSARGMREVMLEVGSRRLRGQRYTAALRDAMERWAERLRENEEEYVEKERLEKVLGKAFSEVIGEQDTIQDYVEWLIGLGNTALQAGAERSHALELGEFIHRWTSMEKGATRILSRGSNRSWALKLSFLDAAMLAGPVFSAVHMAVLMSGTLCPPVMYADLLGVPAERRMTRTYASPFPAERRKMMGLKGITTQYTKRGDLLYERYADCISAIAGAVGGNVAAFFPSYQVMEEIAERLQKKGKRLVIEERSMTKRDREHIVELLRERKERSLMLAVQGGGLSEGIDYMGNILSAVAVVGLPLAPPNLEVKALVRHYASEFGAVLGNAYGYVAPAINKVVQSAGRLIRSERDRGIVILMDERLAQRRYLEFLPPEMRPARFEEIEEIIEEIRAFYSMMQ
ncbi:MAG: helicase C-terminal domain-containing protein [Candidatus Thermoplasmatota archaeon]